MHQSRPEAIGAVLFLIGLPSSNHHSNYNPMNAVVARGSSQPQDAKQHALIALGRTLRDAGYHFVAVTPATHQIVIDRPEQPTSLLSMFGWNRPFHLDAVEPGIVDNLERAGMLEPVGGGRYRSAARFATIDDLIFAHSAFPTRDKEAVFFGPDTYRFARLLRLSLTGLSKKEGLQLVDVGCGSGAGGIYAAKLLGTEVESTLADINPRALDYSAANAAINETVAATVLSDALDEVNHEFDVVIANPPYLVDDEQRLYRHGGWDFGMSVAARIVEQALAKLASGGRLILYTGAPIAEGVDLFFETVRPLLQLYGQHFVYEEIDPDVFGEELLRLAYARAERIAAVGLTVFNQG
jgi:methylase of polypeptide subunit release factors